MLQKFVAFRNTSIIGGKTLYFIILKYKLQKNLLHYSNTIQFEKYIQNAYTRHKIGAKKTYSEHFVQEYRGYNPFNTMMTIYLNNNLQAVLG